MTEPSVLGEHDPTAASGYPVDGDPIVTMPEETEADTIKRSWDDQIWHRSAYHYQARP